MGTKKTRHSLVSLLPKLMSLMDAPTVQTEAPNVDISRLLNSPLWCLYHAPFLLAGY